VAKFLKYGRGILTVKFIQGRFKSNMPNPGEASWQDLTNPSLYGWNVLHGIYQAYLDKFLRQAEDPEVFGDVVAPLFIHTTSLDEEVKFTAEECFIFAREALLEQKRVSDLKNLKQSAEEAQAYMEDTKSKREKREDAMAIIEKAKAAGVIK